MSIVANQKTLERGLRAEFVKAWALAEDAKDVSPYIMETKSNGRDEEYGWLGQSPTMSEWIDERRKKSLNSFDYTLKNKDYEATMPVARNDLEDDRLGAVQMRIADMAVKAKSTHPRKLFFEALLAGTTALCYDGATFFSASHSEGDSGTQSNLVSSTGITLAALDTDIDTAIARMKGFKDDIGEPFDESDVQIGVVCSLALEAVFNKLNTADKIGDDTNTKKGKLTITASGRLTGNTWYLGNLKPGLKPFIRQIRQAVQFNSLQNDSDAGFMTKIFYYGVDSREVFGYGLWQKMIKVG